MSKVVIDGREFPLPENFTFREMQTVKRLTGLRAGEVAEALFANDTDVALAFAVIAKRRAGEQISEDQALDMPASTIVLDFSDDDGEDENVPPADAAAEAATDEQ